MSSFDNTSSSSSISSTISCASFSTIEYSAPIIQNLLLEDGEHFEVVLNNYKRSAASCWKSFGFPARKNNETMEKVIIPGFVSYNSSFARTSTSNQVP
ncbi:unnamed protein product [Rotaria sp. Silwood2]|nr:unnamed protein product [Rotaria sp. Silwood2]